MSKYNVLTTLLVIMLFTSAILTAAAVDGPTFSETVPTLPAAPGLLDYLTYAFDNMGFLFSVATYTWTECPWWLQWTFGLMGFLAVFLIINIVRGNA